MAGNERAGVLDRGRTFPHRLCQVSDHSRRRQDHPGDHGMEQREGLEEREVNHDRGDQRRGHSADSSLDGLFRTDPRGHLVPAERPSHVVRARIASPDHEQEEEDQLRSVGEVVAQPDQRSAQQADVCRGQHRDRARWKGRVQVLRPQDVPAGDGQQRGEHPQFHGKLRKDEGGDDDQHDRLAEHDRNVIALPAAEREELVHRQDRDQRDRRVEDVRVPPAHDPDGDRSGGERGDLAGMAHGLGEHGTRNTEHGTNADGCGHRVVSQFRVPCSVFRVPLLTRPPRRTSPRREARRLRNAARATGSR